MNEEAIILKRDAAGRVVVTEQQRVDLVRAYERSGLASGIVTVSGSGDPMELAQVGQVVLTGGGDNYTVESTPDSVVSLLNSTPAVTERLTASGSGTTVLQALPSTPLSGGVARASVVTAAALVALFQSVSSVAEAMTAQVMGDPTAIVQPAELFLSGGQDPASVSTVNELVGLLNGTPEVVELIQTTGSGETVVTAGTVSLSGGGEQVNPNGTRTYGWDVHGRLALVSLPNGQVHSYSYDYRTRRIGLQQTAAGAEPAKSTAVVFSGGLSLAEYESQVTQTTIASPSQSTVRYVRGPDMGGGVGGLLYSRRAQAVKFNLSNGRGDIVAQSDTSGALTWTASYEAYGKRTKETGENLDKQRGNSKDEDPTGLLNEGFRYRDLETGVWLSRDPAGFVDGPNVYAYVKQNPWTYFDPRGLNRVVVSGGANEDLKKDREHDKNWKNFITAAEKNIIESKRKLKEGEEIEWMVQKSSYQNRAKNDRKSVDTYTKEIEAIASKHGVNLRYFDSPSDLVSMINRDKIGKVRSGNTLISDFTFYGHGVPGQIFTRAGLLSSDAINAGKLRSGELAIDRNVLS